MDQPTAEKALKALEPLIGEWTTELVPTGDTPIEGTGRVTFEWDDSRAFLIQRSTVDIPEAPDSVSIIGCDAANGTYSQLYSDDRGVCRIFAMSIDADGWRLWREGAPFAQSFTGRFEEEGATIHGRWERADQDGELQVDFDLIYRRAA